MRPHSSVKKNFHIGVSIVRDFTNRTGKNRKDQVSLKGFMGSQRFWSQLLRPIHAVVKGSVDGIALAGFRFSQEVFRSDENISGGEIANTEVHHLAVKPIHDIP